MTIAIDFDGTFAADPELFRLFVASAGHRGHTCVLVTGRSPDGESGEEVRRAVAGLMPIVFAGRWWKTDAAQQAGYAVDLWIDDMPMWIGPQRRLLGPDDAPHDC